MKKLLLILLCVPLIGFGQNYEMSGAKCISGDCKNGYGEFTTREDNEDGGEEYSGYFKNGKFHGFGWYSYLEGCGSFSYNGFFKEGEFNGIGRSESCENGCEIYVGEWKDGKKDGQGTLWSHEADLNLVTIYVGSFSGNLKNGKGKMIYQDGKIKVGLWRNDEFIGEE